MKVIKKIVKAICFSIMWVYVRLTMRVRVYGRENIPKDGPYILYCNHKSMFDPIVLEVFWRRYIHFFAKQGLSSNGFKKFFMDCFDSYPVSHTGKDIGAIRWALKHLKAGNVVGIFPEGTRNRTKAQLLQFQEGLGVIAHMGKARLLPVAIVTDYKFLGKVKINVGEVQYPENYYSQKLTKELKEEMSKDFSDKVANLLNK
ncbi:MAG: 1-acyl-sn-glycerol-3-phosphate acyltransferase [Clostridiales bacterium]|nr:1-acyl-sn-glycerol-3-phosphate acyltransferase [Clostridiales bacterium]